MASTKQDAYSLLDQLDSGQLEAVVHLLQVMTKSFVRSLAETSVEQEEITPETGASLDRARASIGRGKGISHEEIQREFGLKK